MTPANSIELRLNSWVQLEYSYSVQGGHSGTVQLIASALLALWMGMTAYSALSLYRTRQQRNQPTLARFLGLAIIALLSLGLFRSTILFRQDQFSLGISGWFLAPLLTAALAFAVLFKHKIDGVKTVAV